MIWCWLKGLAVKRCWGSGENIARLKSFEYVVGDCCWSGVQVECLLMPMLTLMMKSRLEGGNQAHLYRQ